ncbi:MAG: GTP 3',8-cyclase MoaA [Bacteroidetes bacterium]|nr:MAG: GTP 3',8-cyclase MoaA [Bacteroidota bacterium]
MNKASLTDSFGRTHDYLRLSLTDACNLRCRYCMPHEEVSVTPKAHLMQVDEIAHLARLFVDLGVKKIRLTGGEPLVRKDFPEILKVLSLLPVELSLSTNAILIDRHVEQLKQVGLKHINISLDSLDSEQFRQMTLRNDFQKVSENLQLLLNEDFRVKINVVVMRGVNENSLSEFVEYTRHHDLDVRFIEFMPFEQNGWNPEQVLSYQEMLDNLNREFPQITRLKDPKHSTAKHYQVKGFKGKFAFISTITAPFCDSCNRLRLTADGKMKNCLFSQGESDLLSALRQGKDPEILIRENLALKSRERGGRFDSTELKGNDTENRSMIKIGG